MIRGKMLRYVELMRQDRKPLMTSVFVSRKRKKYQATVTFNLPSLPPITHELVGVDYDEIAGKLKRLPSPFTLNDHTLTWSELLDMSKVVEEALSIIDDKIDNKGFGEISVTSFSIDRDRRPFKPSRPPKKL